MNTIMIMSTYFVYLGLFFIVSSFQLWGNSLYNVILQFM